MGNLISLLCWSIAAASWAAISTLLFHRNESVFPPSNVNEIGFWGQQSWVRKYKPKYKIPGSTDMGIFITAPSNWYYRIFNIDYKERFPLSATLLVVFTDGFHLLQFVMISCLTISLVTFIDFTHANSVKALIIYGIFYRVVWGIAFSFFFSILKRKPDKP